MAIFLKLFGHINALVVYIFAPNKLLRGWFRHPKGGPGRNYIGTRPDLSAGWTKAGRGKEYV